MTKRLVTNLVPLLPEVPEHRKEILQSLISYIQHRKDHNLAVALNFICTHNSRRSHLGQVWAQVFADSFRIPAVICYSGGTEVTALHPMIARVLESDGLRCTPLYPGTNTVYAIAHSNEYLPIIGFSKRFDHPMNPQEEFAAIMTCSQASEACPLIPGASFRISLDYEDPKAFDTSPDQESHYLERSRQIASEMHFIFSNIK